VYEALKIVLVEELQMGAADLTPAAGCAEVGLDSLTAAELSAALKSRLDIEIHDYELLELTTLEDVARLMAERHEAAPAKPSHT
jgi:acyl carrier protein